MQTKGVIDRFSVQPVLMLSYLHAPETGGGQDRRRKEPETAGFNSILAKHIAATQVGAP